MNGFPRSFLVVLAFAMIAVGLIVYFVCKQFMLRRHKRRGEEALKRGDYRDAIRSFGRAEGLWDLNATKQTTASDQRDLATLEEILNGLQKAAVAGGISLALDEYHEALRGLHSVFRGNEPSGRTSVSKVYAAAFMRLKSARSALREQLRAINSNGRPAQTV